MTGLAQDAVDYGNDAQMRVAADTRCLLKKTTLAVTSGTAEYPLAADVILVAALIDPNGCEVAYANTDDALSWKSGSQTGSCIVAHYRIGSLIGFIPTPTESASYTLYYYARPAALNSDSTFEVTDDYELLVDHLVEAMKLADDGQPELAAAGLSFYQLDAPRLKRRAQREQSDMFRTR